MHTSIKLTFRASRVQGKEGDLLLQFIRNGNVKVVTTPYKIWASEWDKESSAVIIDDPSPQRERYLRDIDDALREEREALTSKMFRLEKSNDYNLQRLADFYLGNEGRVLFSTFVNELETILQRGGLHQTASVYQIVHKQLIDFCKEQKLFLKKIDLAFIQNYKHFLKNEAKKSNAALFYLRNLKAIYNRAAQQDLIEGVQHNIFADMYVRNQDAGSSASSETSLDDILNSGLPTHIIHKKLTNLKLSLDMFILSYLFRGIYFIDLAYLKKSDLKNNVLSYVSRKNGKPVEIKITQEMQRIIDRYADMCKDSPYLLPILNKGVSNEVYGTAIWTQNQRLKDISDLIQVDGKLTTLTPVLLWEALVSQSDPSVK